MKIFLTLLLSLICFYSHAQNVALDWVKTFGSTGAETGKILRNDSEGNLFIVGQFQGTVDFDPGPGVANKTSNGGIDIYIQKLDSNGNFLWVNTFGNTTNDIVEQAQIDKVDNIVLTGRFFSSIDFDPSSNVDIKSSNGFSDAYVLKLSNTGNYLWTKTFGGIKHETSRGLSINSTNDITVAGVFLDTVDFDPGPGVVHKSALTVDIYILQLSASGNFNWVKTLVGPTNSSVQVNDILFDKNDNLLMNASYKDSIDVDPGPGTYYLVDTVDSLQYNLFFLKLDPNGNFVWAKQFENIVGGSVGISKIAYDSVGNYYLGGMFYGNVDFDFSTTIFNIITPKNASYVLKMDSNANFIWAKHMGGFSGIAPEYESVFGMAIDAQSTVTLCGSFKGYEDFDPGPGVFYLGYPNYISHTYGYIMQLNQNGSFNWAKSIGKQPSAASANSIILTKTGSFYIAGDFFDNTDFDFNAGVHNIQPQGSWDAFILKIKNCSSKISNDVINSCVPITWIDGNVYSMSNFTAKDTLASIDGCDSVVTLNLTITPPIDTTISKAGNTITSNAIGASYQWVDCENIFALIAGATNQSFTPTFNGSFAVIITNGSCSDTSYCYPLSALSIENLEMNQISIFPNPTKGQINVVSNGQDLSMKLYNALGQLTLVKKLKGNNKTTIIDLGKITKGFYSYSFWKEEQLVSRGKLILE